MRDFAAAIATLKRTIRRGWARDGVNDPESVADHSFGLALLAMVAPLPAGVDRDRLIRLALVHDLAEATVGDLLPGEITKREKHAREAAAIRELVANLPPDRAREIAALWAEYESHATPTAHLAHDLDKIEMLLQAYAYEVADNPPRLDSFWTSERDRIADPTLAEFLAWLEAQRRPAF